MAVTGANPLTGCSFFMYAYAHCRVNVSLPGPLPQADHRNLLISVNGRARNNNISLDKGEHSFVIEWGSVVFIRVLDTGPEYSKTHECDFLAIPEISPFEGEDIKIAFLNEPGMLSY